MRTKSSHLESSSDPEDRRGGDPNHDPGEHGTDLAEEAVQIAPIGANQSSLRDKEQHPRGENCAVNVALARTAAADPTSRAGSRRREAGEGRHGTGQ